MSILKRFNRSSNSYLIALCCGFALIGPSADPSTSAQSRTAVTPAGTSTITPGGPLSFVRALAVQAITLRATDPPLKPTPSPRPAERVRQATALRERAAKQALREEARSRFRDAIMVRLATVRGLITLPAEELPSPDARLHLTIDRVGVHTGAAREVWLRVAARLEPAAAGAPAGPFYAIGTAASPKWLIKPGYVWTDSDLLAEAARQASRQIVHTLRTGDEALFVRASRAAVIPAMIPAAARKINEIEGAESFVSAADVQRQADVLFQPGLTPVVDVVARDEVLGAMKKLGLKPERIWSADGSPAVESACAVGRHLDADFVFVSRISDISLTRRTASILQMGVTRIGEELNAEVEVTGAFIRTADSRVLWQDSVTGSSAARTQFTKRGPRIRKEDQCLSDAARVGYSWLRSSFENHKRQFEK